MDPTTKRNKKSDKAKKSYELHGGYTQKHIRILETLKTSSETLKDTTKPSTTTNKSSNNTLKKCIIIYKSAIIHSPKKLFNNLYRTS
jgi:hypothetical protein